MKIIWNNRVPWKGFAAINLFGVILARNDAFRNRHIPEQVLRHEAIHTAQMRELLYIGFYLLYLLEWGVRLFLPGNAYRQISFEREAYLNDRRSDYLSARRSFAMWRKG